MGDLLVEKRRVLRIGGSSAITLPQSFINTHHIAEGDELVVVVSDGKLTITVPERDDGGKQSS